MPHNLPSRPTDFRYPDDFDPVWVRRLPELACVANAVSLLMPYAEPYVARSVTRVRDDLPPSLAETARDYVRQETAHHREHQRFNAIVTDQVRGLRRVTAAAAWVYRWLDQRDSSFNVAFAAGFETVAFAAARWVDKRANDLFIGADEVPAALFLWHLAEEAEHRSAAFDVMKALGIGRYRYGFAMAVSALVLALFVVPLTIVLLFDARRLFHPVAHLRLAWWTLTFLCDLIPDMLFSLRASHHPSNLAPPEYLLAWLAHYDAATYEPATYEPAT
ncbi:MAG: metal-dependent hydrolase [Acidimicrobiales bacterium]